MKMVYVLRVSYFDKIYETRIQCVEVFAELKDAEIRQEHLIDTGKYTDSLGRTVQLHNVWIDAQEVK